MNTRWLLNRRTVEFTSPGILVKVNPGKNPLPDVYFIVWTFAPGGCVAEPIKFLTSPFRGCLCVSVQFYVKQIAAQSNYAQTEQRSLPHLIWSI